jgi:P5-type ATPase cation transporter
MEAAKQGDEERRPLLQGTAARSYSVDGTNRAASLNNSQTQDVTNTGADGVSDIPETNSSKSSSQEFIVDDDLSFTILGRVSCGDFFYNAASILSLGGYYLVCRWFPMVEINALTRPSTLEKATHLIVENQWHELCLVKVERVSFGAEFSKTFVESPDCSVNVDSSAQSNAAKM